MTRISNNKLAAIAGGLLSLVAAGAVVAQETGGDRYARALAEAAITQRYNTQIEQQLRSQEQEIASLEQQIAGIDTTAVDVQTMLQRMYDDLVAFVQNDVPFFKEERDHLLVRLIEGPALGRERAEMNEEHAQQRDAAEHVEHIEAPFSLLVHGAGTRES